MGALPLSVRSHRYPSLDFWRGIACLMVLVFHSTFYFADLNQPAPDRLSHWIYAAIRCFWQGVPIFFVISGYCITAACENMQGSSAGARQYFWRRFRRIFPPFWIFLGCAGVLVAGVGLMGHRHLFLDTIHPIPSPQDLSAAQWFGNFTLTEIWRTQVTGGSRLFFIEPAWSLCYEEQFYAVCGILLFTARRRFFTGVLLVSLAVAVVAFIHYARREGNAQFVDHLDGFFFDGRWLVFATGVLVYYRLVHASRRASHLIDALMVLGLAGAWIACRIEGSILAKELRVGLIFGIALIFLRRREAIILNSAVLRPITWCGTMCYSVYLVHWPVVKLVSHILYLQGVRGAWPTLLITLPVCAAVAIPLSWLFHVAFERRFLNTRQHLPHLHSRPQSSANKVEPNAEAVQSVACGGFFCDCPPVSGNDLRKGV